MLVMSVLVVFGCSTANDYEIIASPDDILVVKSSSQPDAPLQTSYIDGRGRGGQAGHATVHYIPGECPTDPIDPMVRSNWDRLGEYDFTCPDAGTGECSLSMDVSRAFASGRTYAVALFITPGGYLPGDRPYELICITVPMRPGEKTHAAARD